MAGPEVNESLTRKVAHLARLELSSEEVSTFTAQLGKILGYIDQLQEVNVDRVEPLLTPVELSTPLREDRVVPPMLDANGAPKMLQPADASWDGCYKVPEIL